MHLKGTNILAVAALTMASVCSNAMADYEYEPSMERVEQISLQDARRRIETAALEHTWPTICSFSIPNGFQDILVTRITFAPDFFGLAQGRGTDRDGKVRPLQSPLRLYYRDLSVVNLEYTTYSTKSDTAKIYLSAKDTKGNAHRLFCHVKRGSPFLLEGAKDLADAFRRLQIEFERTGSPAAEAAFQQVVQRYHGANPKPEFPESARRFRVQAESALRDKRFGDAAERYAEALEAAPWWPEGRFNLALILGELEYYDSAMRELKRYLQLVPNAANARQAQDKIYEWEGKGK